MFPFSYGIVYVSTITVLGFLAICATLLLSCLRLGNLVYYKTRYMYDQRYNYNYFYFINLYIYIY